jgi:hypothetical protein
LNKDTNGDILLEDDTDDEDFDPHEDDWVQPMKNIATKELGQMLINQWLKKSLRK